MCQALANNWTRFHPPLKNPVYEQDQWNLDTVKVEVELVIK